MGPRSRKPRSCHRALLKHERFQSLRGSQLAGLAAAIVQYVRRDRRSRTANAWTATTTRSCDVAAIPDSRPRRSIPTLEEALLGRLRCSESIEELGPGDPFVKAVVGGETAGGGGEGESCRAPSSADPALRKSLVEGGSDAIAESTDPLIVLARTVDPFVREMQQVDARTKSKA